MKVHRNIFVPIIFLCSTSAIQSSTIVYNLRIAEATKRQIAESGYLRPSTLITALVSQFSKSRDDINFSYTGGLIAFQRSRKSMYFRIDTAVAHVSQKKDDIKFSRTQTDDILISGGYSHAMSERARFTISGIFGIPTHKDDSLTGIQFGTGHFGLGAQLDGAFFYSPHLHHNFVAAVRYIRFFPRDISLTVGPQCVKFNFNIGNLIDLYIAHDSKWGQHRLEVGYNPTFVFQAHICPRLDVFTNKVNFIRSSFFANYRYVFLINKKFPSSIAGGLSYGFEHIPKDVGLKRVITVWVGWGINF